MPLVRVAGNIPALGVALEDNRHVQRKGHQHPAPSLGLNEGQGLVKIAHIFGDAHGQGRGSAVHHAVQVFGYPDLPQPFAAQSEGGMYPLALASIHQLAAGHGGNPHHHGGNPCVIIKNGVLPIGQLQHSLCQQAAGRAVTPGLLHRL